MQVPLAGMKSFWNLLCLLRRILTEGFQSGGSALQLCYFRIVMVLVNVASLAIIQGREAVLSCHYRKRLDCQSSRH